MKHRSSIQQIAPLLAAPTFTAREAARLGVPAANIAYYVNRGDLERVAHGVYRAPAAPSSTYFRWEDLVTASRVVKDGVVCLISALAVYELTDEIPRQHWIAIRSTTRHRGGPMIRVVRMRNLILGKTEIEVGGISLSIFDRERTIVDVFRRLGPEVAIKALRAGLAIKDKKSRLDLLKLRAYARELRFHIDPYLLAVTT